MYHTRLSADTAWHLKNDSKLSLQQWKKINKLAFASRYVSRSWFILCRTPAKKLNPHAYLAKHSEGYTAAYDCLMPWLDPLQCILRVKWLELCYREKHIFFPVMPPWLARLISTRIQQSGAVFCTLICVSSSRMAWVCNWTDAKYHPNGTGPMLTCLIAGLCDSSFCYQSSLSKSCGLRC
jgi:hypothetical protein